MKLDTHWLIKSVGHKPNEKSVVLPISEIVKLAGKMHDQDVIYTYHMEKRLDRIALYGTGSDDIFVSIQGCGGSFDKSYHLSELDSVLNKFEEIQRQPEEYGFKPDWE